MQSLADYDRSATKTDPDRCTIGRISVPIVCANIAIVINVDWRRWRTLLPRGTKDITRSGCGRVYCRCCTHICSTRKRVRTRDRGHASRARLTVPADIFRFRSPSRFYGYGESERRVGGIARTNVAVTRCNLGRPLPISWIDERDPECPISVVGRPLSSTTFYI